MEGGSEVPVVGLHLSRAGSFSHLLKGAEAVLRTLLLPSSLVAK